MKNRFHIKTLCLLISMLPSILSVAQTTITVNGVVRSMIVYVPPGLPSNPPLVISMHGLSENAVKQQRQTNWNAVADTAKIIVVYPEGSNARWDIGGRYDIDFLNTIIDEMYAIHKIDRNRIYVSGFSMGGMMTYHAANHLADKIAAFGPVGGYMHAPANSSRAISLIHIHGMEDDAVPYAAMNSTMTGAYFPGIHSYLKNWISRNNCSAISQLITPYPVGTSNVSSKERWSNGDCNVEVELVSIKGIGHWYSNDSRGVYTTTELWNFFRRYNLQCGTMDCAGELNGTAYLDNCGVCVGGNTTAMPCTGTVEAENPCSVDGIALENINAGYSGEGYVNTTNAVDAYASWMLSSSGNDAYTLSFRFANGGGISPRDARLMINGEQKGTLMFPSTGSWSTWANASITLELAEGVHELRLESITAGGLPNLDVIYFSQGIHAETCLITNIAGKRDKSYQVFPNPANGKVQWSEEQNWELLNAKAERLDSDYGNEIDLSEYHDGIYFLRIGYQIIKVVRQ